MRIFIFALSLIFIANLTDAQPDTLDFFSEPDLSHIDEQYKLLYKSGLSQVEIEQFKQNLAIKSVSLKRSGCYGPCPVYNLTFYLSGTAEYNGIRNVNKKGNYTGKISIWNYGKLCYLIDNIGFTQLEDKYRLRATDLASVTIIVNYKNGDQKKVYDYGSQGPIEFWSLTKAIDGIKNEIDWKKNE